jgi:hypothetical protein
LIGVYVNAENNRQAELRLDGIDSFDGIGSEFLSVVKGTGTSALVTRKDGYSLSIQPDETGALAFSINSPEGVRVGGGRNLGSAVDSAADAHHRAVTASAPEVDWDQDTDIIVIEDGSGGNPYRVPNNVREDITAALSNLDSQVTEDDLTHANNLAYADAATLEDVQWIAAFFEQYDGPAQLHGGHKGKKWAEKILTNIADGTDTSQSDDGTDDSTGFDFQSSEYVFYAIGNDADTTEATALIAVDFDTAAVYSWVEGDLSLNDGLDPDDVDYPLVLMIDADTAQALAAWIDSDPDDSASYELLDTDPLERNLFLIADSEIDYEELAIIADATGYTPAERSINSTRQSRDGEGHFHGEHVKQGLHLGDTYAKARLEQELPIVTDPAALISAWMTQKAVVAAATEDPTADTPVQNTKNIMAPKDAEKPVAPMDPEPEDMALYIGIVDSTDTTAILDVIAVTKNEEGTAEAFRRQDGDWVFDEGILDELQGATPPTVVELKSPEPLKTVLAQVDTHDGGAALDTSDTPVAAAALSAAQRGYCLPDGSFLIRDAQDLREAVEALPLTASAESGEVVRHLRKRARALNRMDVLPSEMRLDSLVAAGEEMAAAPDLFGEYGEVLVAASTEGARGGAKGMKGYAKLRDYWCHGAGAAKIRWGTPGDLTRAHAHLSKYVGAMAWGLAANYHKYLFGMSNAKHDKLTGQTEHHSKG